MNFFREREGNSYQITKYIGKMKKTHYKNVYCSVENINENNLNPKNNHKVEVVGKVKP